LLWKKTALPLTAYATNSIDEAGELFGFMNVKAKDLAYPKCIFFLLCWY